MRSTYVGGHRPPEADLPPLMRGYLRAGALVCGEPAWDPEFSTADFLMLIAMDNVSGRYARRFALAHDAEPRDPLRRAPDARLH